MLRIVFIPSIRGVIKRRLLVNFKVDPEVVQRFLPDGLSPKLQGDHAIAGICLIRLEQIRPSLVPWSVGLSGENAAHRVAVTWRNVNGVDQEGVYIPMRHTNSSLILMGWAAGYFPAFTSGQPSRWSIRAPTSTSRFERPPATWR